MFPRDLAYARVIGALSVAALAYVSNTVDASTAAVQTIKHVRTVYTDDDDDDSNIRADKRGAYTNRPSGYGDDDKDSLDDKGDVYSQKAGGKTKRRSGDDEDVDSRDSDVDVYGKQPSVYRN